MRCLNFFFKKKNSFFNETTCSAQKAIISQHISLVSNTIDVLAWLLSCRSAVLSSQGVPQRIFNPKKDLCQSLFSFQLKRVRQRELFPIFGGGIIVNDVYSYVWKAHFKKLRASWSKYDNCLCIWIYKCDCALCLVNCISSEIWCDWV